MRFKEHERFMRYALEKAGEAKERGEVPVGCVIADKEGNIVAAYANTVECDGCFSSHAELRALEAAQKSGIRDFSECTLYTTLEPCGMCAGAIAHFRVGRVVFGAFDKEFGCMVSKINLPHVCGHTAECTGGVCEDECSALLNDFFATLRQ